MKLNRRQFLLLSAGFAAGCQSPPNTASLPPGGIAHFVAAGNIADYPNDGVYSQFVSRGFFLIRRNGQFEAHSSICTHRKCKLTALPNHSFYCKCHGSAFDPDGHVTHGPARRDLPGYLVSTDDRGGLFVTLGGD